MQRDTEPEMPLKNGNFFIEAPRTRTLASPSASSKPKGRREARRPGYTDL
jgi:hypothetical protein